MLTMLKGHFFFVSSVLFYTHTHTHTHTHTPSEAMDKVKSFRKRTEHTYRKLVSEGKL